MELFRLMISLVPALLLYLQQFMLSLRMQKSININNLPKMYSEDPNKVNYSMLVQSRENSMPYSTERIKYLKELFNDILKNVLPIENQATLVVFDHISIGKWVKLQNSKQHKFVKNEKNDKEKTLEEKIIEICTEYKYSPNLVEYFK
mmetsp:Transcript_20347/g.18014  ORF Transcript_20347/g.18014 Transcript_20347/m.18014 type:complete len:147 (+) Transcript_20347:231-671(+)